MKLKSALIVLLMTAGLVTLPAQKSRVTGLTEDYIREWKRFYPTRACQAGFLEEIFHFEDYSLSSIQAWVQINKDTLAELQRLGEGQPHEHQINARLLRVSIEREIHRWEQTAPHLYSLDFYVRPITRTRDRMDPTPILSPRQRIRVIQKGLICIHGLCRAADRMVGRTITTFRDGQIKSLHETETYLKKELAPEVREHLTPARYDDLVAQCRSAGNRIHDLMKKIKKSARPVKESQVKDILGREAYAGQLRLYTDRNLSPEDLEKMAREEIRRVRDRIAVLARAYFEETDPGEKMPADFQALVAKAFGDMEKNRPAGGEEYLELFRNYAREARQFIAKHDLITLPPHPSLSIELVPESAGPMARIGYVQPAPPFHPNPWTTLFLPSIPDSFPQKERDDFWRSFNNHFSRFIVIHELIPGHYLQAKIARENPHPVRRLFPFGLYAEGWASFCEEVVLDAGWDDHNKLTRLAQLRKRLENANRAYMSVQVHCNGWTEEKVRAFSTRTALLAPQFARSLWWRILNAPLQMTSYFLGTVQLEKVYREEKERLGERFNIKTFLDTVLRAGPIPFDEFPRIFRENHPSGPMR